MPLNAAAGEAAALPAQGGVRALESLKRQHEAWRRKLIRLRADLALLDEANNLEALVMGPFAEAVQAETVRRMDRFLAGVQAYRRHPAHRDFAEPDVLMTDGQTRLLDFAALGDGVASDTALLMIPSLVNRWQVLDIAEDRSLMRALARNGVRALLVDWGAPGSAEREFSATDYVLRLERIFDRLRGMGFERIHIGGYCMGGLLALALALRRQEATASLVLLATPWDFHADRTGQALMMANLPFLARLVEAAGELPVDALQTLFYSLDPWLVIRKFTRFGQLDMASREARDFVLLEDWLNDGAALSGPLALDCLLGWYGANTPGRGEWRIAGEPVDPRRFAKPALVIVPGQDRIVPPASARALAAPAPQAMPAARRLDLALGHIGMVVSSRTSRLLWQPMLDWLRQAG